MTWMNKFFTAFCLQMVIICSFVLSTTFSVYAEPSNVLDCLENEKECEEQNEQMNELDDGNNELLNDDHSLQSSFAFNVIKMIVALLFVLGLIYVILIILRKRNKLVQQHDIIENLGGIPLGQNKSIQIIRIGSHVYAVGVGDNIELMLEITDAHVLHRLLNKDNVGDDDQILGNLFKRKAKDDTTKQHFIEQLNSELHKLRNNREKLIHKTEMKDDEHG